MNRQYVGLHNVLISDRVAGVVPSVHQLHFRQVEATVVVNSYLSKGESDTRKPTFTVTIEAVSGCTRSFNRIFFVERERDNRRN